MARADDPSAKSYFQSDRFFQVDKQWFFYVRETNEQGPFPTKEYAQSELHAYLKTQIGISTWPLRHLWSALYRSGQSEWF